MKWKTYYNGLFKNLTHRLFLNIFTLSGDWKGFFANAAVKKWSSAENLLNLRFRLLHVGTYVICQDLLKPPSWQGGGLQQGAATLKVPWSFDHVCMWGHVTNEK